jgi:dipeptidase E
MKLVLYSDQIPTQTDSADDRMLALIDKRRASIAYIPSSPDPGRVFYRSRKEYYARLGIEVQPYVDIPDLGSGVQLDNLLNADAIHLSGGNTFVFLYRLHSHGLLDPLRRYVARGGVLIGVSAGAILMTPSILTTLLCGDKQSSATSDPFGLGLVEFAFVPHLGRYASMTELQSYSRRHSQTLYACPDGAAIVIDGDALECVGNVLRIEATTDSEEDHMPNNTIEPTR